MLNALLSGACGVTIALGVLLSKDLVVCDELDLFLSQPRDFSIKHRDVVRLVCVILIYAIARRMKDALI